MADEGFLRRWARLKATPEQVVAAPPAPPAPPAPAAPAPAPVAASVPAVVVAPGPLAFEGDATLAAPALPLPTIAEAAALTGDSDFSAFVAKNVDAAVRRLAMKKLFADPHFQGHDGLDIYMGDYNLPSPVSADMLADMTHNKNIFAKLDEVIEQVDGMLGAPSADAAPPVASEDSEDRDDRQAGPDSAEADLPGAADGLAAPAPTMHAAHGTPSIKTPEPATLPAPDQDIA